MDKSVVIDQAAQAAQAVPSAQPDRPSVHQPSPYLALYLSGTKRSARNLVFQTTETPLPPLSSASRKTND